MRKIFLYFIFILIVFDSNSQNLFSKDEESCGSPNYVLEKFTSATSIIDICENLSSFSIKSFIVFYQPQIGNPETIRNTGSNFIETIKPIIIKAKSGDIYYFEDIVISTDKGLKKYPPIAIKIQ